MWIIFDDYQPLNNDKQYLNEVKRWDIINRSRRESPPRFDKKKFYKASDFNNVNFKELFENNTFTWSSRVGKYIVTISFEGAFDILRWKVKSYSGRNRWKRINHKLLADILSEALDRKDLYFDCSCDDFKYRYAYWATKNKCKYGKQQNRPPTVRNVKNNKGFCCKHILAVLYGKYWVSAASKRWLQFIQENPDLSEWYIWDKYSDKNKNRAKPNYGKNNNKNNNEESENDDTE